ncbi:hypothetical protein GCM10027174_00770 [Salinifilum aidingensis]
MPRGGVRPLKTFGRIDPFCWLAAVPGVIIAIVLAMLGTWVLGFVALVMVALLLLFDSWANRPFPEERPSRREGTPPPPGGSRERPRGGAGARPGSDRTRSTSSPGTAQRGTQNRPPRSPQRPRR